MNAKRRKRSRHSSVGLPFKSVADKNKQTSNFIVAPYSAGGGGGGGTGVIKLGVVIDTSVPFLHLENVFGSNVQFAVRSAEIQEKTPSQKIKTHNSEST